MNRKEGALLLLVALCLIPIVASVQQALAEGQSVVRGSAGERSTYSASVAQSTATLGLESTPTQDLRTPTQEPPAESSSAETQAPVAPPTFDSSSTGDF